MSRLRIGFVGTGSMGQVAHLANYDRLPDEVEVAAIAEPRPQLAAQVALRHSVPAVYASAAEMMAAEKLDALVAPQPFWLHRQIIAPLYEYGVPIFTEKPFAMSSAVGRDLLAHLDASPAPFHMVGYHKRADPAIVAAKSLVADLLASGRWGAMRYVRMTMAGDDWSLGAFDDMVATDEPVPAAADDAPRDEDYFQFINFYVHQVNLLRHLLGERYRVTHADPSGRLLVGRSDSGVPLTLEMRTWGDPEWDESVVVGFDGGWVRVQLPAPLASRRAGVLSVRGDQGSGWQTVTPSMPPVHAMLAQAKSFLAAVRGEADPLCEAHDAFEDLLVADQYFAERVESTLRAR